jgi:hypothetical protein
MHRTPFDSSPRRDTRPDRRQRRSRNGPVGRGQSRAVTVISGFDPPARPPDWVQVRAGRAPAREESPIDPVELRHPADVRQMHLDPDDPFHPKSDLTQRFADGSHAPDLTAAPVQPR